MKVFLDSVGCRLNQSELERLARKFDRAGYTIAASPKECDLVVINTCTVTSAAAAESRAKARRAHRQNPQAGIVLTGCWSSMEPAAAANLPGVTSVVPNAVKDLLVDAMAAGNSNPSPAESHRRVPLPGIRRRTRAFIKVQDGCDNHCTYCVTTLARGTARSEPPETILEDVRLAVEGGVKEIVLTGVQLSAYGNDFASDVNLSSLVKKILETTDIPRLRLSSLEPWGLPFGFFSLWENPRMCRQLHLPLQSGSKGTLRRMGRPISPKSYAALIRKARQVIPDVAITTDIIVGFPGERDADFEESLDFIGDMNFSGIHVFTYSPRPRTAAVRLPDRVPVQIARERARKVKAVAAASGRTFISQFIGRSMPVLWIRSQRMKAQKWRISGLTDNYIRVHTSSSKDLWNQLTPVRLVSLAEQGGLQGEIVANQAQNTNL
jgi:threonylcarbamoyladenosine tRNA methylthiotransferase MtaB